MAGLTNEINELCLATDAVKLEPGGGVQAEGENIETLLLPLAEVMDELDKLKEKDLFIDLKVYAGLHFLSGAQRR